ncbi:MAG: hypothetical protein K2H83_05390 [Duncaniella sp.]|nr:hypothetical protein [Duncaniella sp.]
MMNLIDTRNRHFITRCRQIMLDTPAGEPISRESVARRAAMSPAPCYYCTYEYALRMLRVLRHGRLPLRNDRRRAMFEEIDARVARLQELRPGTSLPTALAHVLAEGRASQYFISPATALSLAERLR